MGDTTRPRIAGPCFLLERWILVLFAWVSGGHWSLGLKVVALPRVSASQEALETAWSPSAENSRLGRPIGSEILVVARLELRDRLIDTIGLVVHVVVRGARDDEDALLLLLLLLRGRLVEEFEPVAVGAKGAHLAAADDGLQGLGQQLLRQMEGVPGEGCTGADDIEPVWRAGLLLGVSLLVDALRFKE